MTRALAISAVVAAGVAALVLALSSGGSDATRYRIVFDNAFGIVEGADFKVAGVRAGQVSRFDLTEDSPPRALVEVEVTEPGLRALRADASCEVRPQSLIGEYFVDCNPGKSQRPLPNDTVTVEHTAGTIALDLVNDVLRRPQRERLPLILNALGAGLAGRPQDVREVLARAHPGLRETNQTLAILARQQRIIEQFVRDSDTVVAQLNARRRDVRRFVDTAGRTAEVSASRRAQLAQSLRRLPEFLGELRPTMARLGELTQAQTPVLRDLRAAGPELDRALRDLEPFSESSEPALRSLGELSDTGSDAIRSSDEEIRELRALAQGAPGFAKPLRQFLQTIDDRERSIEPDPRAANTAPPAPDKTADAAGKGFTGMESVLNYLFWQTLSINSFDEVGHVLRFTATINDCSEFSTNPSAALRERCASYLGPYQPGVTDPDPTEGFDRLSAEERAARVERETNGGAAAAPSKPLIDLPPMADELLEQLGRPAPSTPEAPGAAGRLLDFLLGP